MAFNQDGSTITAQCPLQKNRRRSEKDISITKITSGNTCTQKENTSSCKLKQESLAQIKKQKQNEGLNRAERRGKNNIFQENVAMAERVVEDKLILPSSIKDSFYPLRVVDNEHHITNDELKGIIAIFRDKSQEIYLLDIKLKKL